MAKKKKKYLYWVFWNANNRKDIVAAIDADDAKKEAIKFCGTHAKISKVEYIGYEQC